MGHIFGWQRRNLRNDIARYIRKFPVAVNGYVPSGHWRSRQPRIYNARTVRTWLWGGDIIILAFASTASFCRERSTMATLFGFLLGSLIILWPWQVTVSSVLDRHGEMRAVQTLLLPLDTMANT